MTPSDINRMLAARHNSAPRLKFANMAEYEQWKADQDKP